MGAYSPLFGACGAGGVYPFLPGGDDPLHPLFWFIMSMAVLVSALTAYPINSWMVARGVKHGMMSPPEKGASSMTGMDHGSMKSPRDEMKGMAGMDHHEEPKVRPLSMATQITVVVVVGQYVPIRFP